MKIRKGDTIQVIAGKDVGKVGQVTRVLPESDRVIVDGVNVAKRHQRQTAQQPAGDRRLKEGCIRENQLDAAYIAEHAADIGGVVTTARASTFVGTGASDSARQVWAHALARTLSTVADAGPRVVLLHDVPRFNKPVAQCAIRKSAQECGVDTSDARSARQPVFDAEQAAVAQSNGKVLTWDPFDVLCDTTRCNAVVDGVVLFRDRAHLSKAGALYVGDRLVPWLTKALAR